MSFGQLTHRESLRDLVLCLQAQSPRLFHMGISNGINKSTLADANENRDWRIYADFALVLIQRARKLYHDTNETGIELDNVVYALDSTTIELCLDVFWWARFRKHKAAVKLHTLLDVKCEIPCFIHVTDGLSHDVNVLDVLPFEPEAFYVMDKGYIDFNRLHIIHQAGSYFVVRAKDNLAFHRVYSSKVDKTTGLRCDQTIKLTGYKTRKDYPAHLRRVKYYDNEHDQEYVYLTNNFEIPALQVAILYRNRWKIETFFKWIKQHLKIKTFWGETQNAVKTQIWIAVCTYVLVAILKKERNISHSLNEILQILSVSLFDKTPVNQLLTISPIQKSDMASYNQLTLWEL
jgi:transposase